MPRNASSKSLVMSKIHKSNDKLSSHSFAMQIERLRLPAFGSSGRNTLFVDTFNVHFNTQTNTKYSYTILTHNVLVVPSVLTQGLNGLKIESKQYLNTEL